MEACLTWVTYCDPDISDASRSGVRIVAKSSTPGARLENGFSLPLRYRVRKTAEANEVAAWPLGNPDKAWRISRWLPVHAAGPIHQVVFGEALMLVSRARSGWQTSI